MAWPPYRCGVSCTSRLVSHRRLWIAGLSLGQSCVGKGGSAVQSLGRPVGGRGSLVVKVRSWGVPVGEMTDWYMLWNTR